MASGYEKHDCGAEPGGHWPKPSRLHDAILFAVAIIYLSGWLFGIFRGLSFILTTVFQG